MKSLAEQHAFVRLDAARGLSAIAVFIAHISQIFFWRLIGDQAPIAVAAAIVARHAVLIFFLLSGHLITRSIILNIRRNGQFDASEYVASRAARIYPPLFGAIAICVLAWLIIKALHLPGDVRYGLPGDIYRARDSFSISAKDLFGAVIMRGGLLDADGSLWTLFIEVQTYTLVMAAAALASRRLLTRVWTFALAVVALSLLRHSLFFVLIWIVGAATAFWSPKKIVAVFLVAGSLIGIAALALSDGAVFGPGMDTLAGEGAQFLCCISYGALLFFFPVRLHYPRAIIATANFSYSLYVIHFPLLLLILSLSQNWIGNSIFRTLVVAIPAAVIIILIVIPFARLLEQQEKWKRILLANDLKVPALHLGRINH